MTKPLYVAHRQRISGKPHPATPSLGVGETGIKIAAGEITYDADEDLLLIEVLIAYAFPVTLWRSYAHLTWAMRVTAENTATGQAGSTTLKDPFVRYPDKDDAPNFLGLQEDPADPSPSVRGGSARLSLKIETLPTDHEPSLYLKATLREHVSNTLSVNVRDLTAVGA